MTNIDLKKKVNSIGQASKILDPTFPTKQLDSIFSLDLPSLLNTHIFQTPHLRLWHKLSVIHLKSPKPKRR